MNAILRNVLLVCGCLIVFWGCREDDDSNNGTTDTSAPAVSSVSPADGSKGIPVNASISVTFSESMGVAGITTNTGGTTCSGTVQVSRDGFATCVQMDGGFSASDGNRTFTITSSSNLSDSAIYMIKVTAGAKDVAGNPLAGEYSTSNGFTTVLSRSDRLFLDTIGVNVPHPSDASIYHYLEKEIFPMVRSSLEWAIFERDVDYHAGAMVAGKLLPVEGVVEETATLAGGREIAFFRCPVSGGAVRFDVDNDFLFEFDDNFEVELEFRFLSPVEEWQGLRVEYRDDEGLRTSDVLPVDISGDATGDYTYGTASLPDGVYALDATYDIGLECSGSSADASMDRIVVRRRDTTEGGNIRDLMFFDELLGILDRVGTDIVSALNYSHRNHLLDDYTFVKSWDPAAQIVPFPPEIPAWRTYVGEMASIYKDRITYWQIWNEPEAAEYWLGTTDRFVELYLAAAEEIRSHSPTAKIVFSGADLVYTHEFIKRDLLNHIDIFDTHTYRLEPEEMWELRRYAELMRYLDKPYWLTEFGWGTHTVNKHHIGVSPQIQAENLIKSMVLLHSAGFERMFWSDIIDRCPNREDEECNFGLIYNNGDWKPSASAMEFVWDFLNGYRYLGWTDHDDPKLYLHLFENGLKYRAVAWYHDDTAEKTFGEGELHQGSVYALDGSELAASGTLVLNNTPIYLDDVSPDIADKAALNFGKVQTAVEQDYFEAVEATWRVDEELGLYLNMDIADGQGQTVVSDGGSYVETRKGDAAPYLYFEIDNTFAYWINGQYEIDLEFHLPSPESESTGFRVTYEKGIGESANSEFVSVSTEDIQSGGDTVVKSVVLKDAFFFGTLGWDFRVDATDSTNDIRIQRIVVRKRVIEY
ncbi:MAG: hypothetical protein GY866_15020 [Proteobacteria bacterium]|nr:hypothetical protein [Pseudomonadota bacterium]